MQFFDVDRLLGDALCGHRLQIVFQWNRSRAEVRAFGRECASADAACVGDGVAEVAGLGSTGQRQHVVRLQFTDHRLDDVKRQFDLIADLTARSDTASRQVLQRQSLDFLATDRGLFERFRTFGPILPVFGLSIAEQEIHSIEQIRQPTVHPSHWRRIGSCAKVFRGQLLSRSLVGRGFECGQCFGRCVGSE